LTFESKTYIIQIINKGKNMKSVVQNIIHQEVSLNQVDEFKYYGITPSLKGTQKGFVAKNDFWNGKFKAFAAEEITKGNCWHIVSEDATNLKEVVGELLDSGFYVYEFDTPQELFKWLSE